MIIDLTTNLVKSFIRMRVLDQLFSSPSGPKQCLLRLQDLPNDAERTLVREAFLESGLERHIQIQLGGVDRILYIEQTEPDVICIEFVCSCTEERTAQLH